MLKSFQQVPDVFISKLFWGRFQVCHSSDQLEVGVERDLRSVNLVLPESMTNFIREKQRYSQHAVEEKDINVKVFDLQGTLYRDVNISADEPYFELVTPLKKGIYIFKVTIDKENSITERIAID